MHEGLGTLELALPLVSTSKGPHADTGRQKNGAPARLRSANGSPREALRIAPLPCRISRQHRKQAVSEVFAQKARRDSQGHRPLTDGSFFAKTPASAPESVFYGATAWFTESTMTGAGDRY